MNCKERKIIIGSKLLNLKNPRDEDYMFFDSCRLRFYGLTLQHFIEGRGLPDDIEKAIYMYQRSAPFHGENAPFPDFDIFEHKKVWIQQLKRYMNSTSVEEYALSKDFLSKRFYHIAYQYYMITENTYYISDQGMKLVQQIHDFEKSPSYFYELRNLINSLPEE